MEKPIPLAQIPATADNLFEALFNEHWNRLHRILSRFTADPDEAEDLCMETYLRLRSHLSSMRTHDNLAGWLYRTATNLGLNALRATHRRSQYERSAFEVLPTTFDNPADEVESRQECEMVRRVLAEIKPREAQILLLRASGLSYQELAVACQVSPSSVGTLLARAEREFEKRYQARYGGYR
ncbi:MAG TPA: sigma-70 family RNA polymerase sigma factor [Anaerolineaceae bacterium]|nr:sigma-70 family RNA polymerase sigma factor [Anaerolineaceae bacterium]